MAVLSHLEPQNVFHFFEEICSIPHGSGNIRQISDYCADFARRRGLDFVQDRLGNVIIFAPGTPGYEDSAPVILQGHMDMVCVKTPECPLDLTKDGLKLLVEGDCVTADGTSLGADDGIAVAMMLALLDSSELPHPPIEALITVDEETGLFGAAGVDISVLKGRKLLNIDSEEEGIFTVSCAGGVRANCTLAVRREEVELPKCRIAVEGLLGGHSGIEIGTGRANANKTLGLVLNAAARAAELRLVALEGGSADNVIARQAAAVVCAADLAALTAAVRAVGEELHAQFAAADPGLNVVVEELPREKTLALTAADTARVLSILAQVPQGVQAMSQAIPGLVQTSLNLGVLRLEEELLLRFALRSSVSKEKGAMLEELRTIFAAQGGEVTTDGDYPAWEYRADSPLRDMMVEVYADLTGKQPTIAAIHAGLECGLFSGKCPDMDCVSIGPDLWDVHSVDEKLSIPSTQRTWQFLLELLRRSK